MGLSINNDVRLSSYKEKYKNKRNNPNFNGFATGAIGALRFLDNSPALGAVAVDVGSMVIPRTAVDMKDRGFNAGVETGVREVASSVNHGIVGLVGAGAAMALSGKFNDDFHVKADKIFANAEAIDVFSSIWKESSSKEDFYRRSIEKYLGQNGSTWKNIALKGEETVADYGFTGDKSLAQAIAETLSPITEETAKKVKLPILKKVEDVIIANTGAVKHKIEIPKVITDAAGNVKESKLVVHNTVGVILDNMVSLGNAFDRQVPEKMPEFLKKLRNLKGGTAILGLAISSLIGMSVQPINRYLTKKRTGQDGFVGVKGQSADNSPKFKVLKTVVGLAAGAASILSIGNIKETPGKLQFSSMVPNMNQFKFLYGMTIMSRLLSARGGDELREGLIKDSLGFLTWLVFGGMVSKTAARAIGGKDMINYIPKVAGEKGFKHGLNWLLDAATKSYDEVLLSDINVKNLLKSGENLKFSKMLKAASNAGKKNVAVLVASQIIGYLFSGLVLGMGIAKLNIAITNKVNKARENKGQKVAFSGSDKTSSLYFAQSHNKPHKKVFEKMLKNV